MVPSVATSAASLAPASGRCSFSVSTVAVVDITYLYRNVPARATTTRTIRISIRPKPRFTGRIVLRPAGHGPALTLLLDLLAEIFERFACLAPRSEEHTSELQSLRHLVCRLLLEKKKKKIK